MVLPHRKKRDHDGLQVAVFLKPSRGMYDDSVVQAVTLKLRDQHPL